MSQEALMQAFAFNSNDLELNRAGRLSPEQRLKLGSRSWKLTLGYSLLALVLAIFSVGPALRIAQLDPSQRDTNDVVLMIVFAVAALIPATLAFMRWRRVMADTVSSKVKSVHGPILIEDQSGNKTTQIIKVNNVEFHIRKDVAKAFTNGVDYTIYYVPNTMTVLSAEMVFIPK